MVQWFKNTQKMPEGLLKNILEVVMYRREGAHMYMYAWLRKEEHTNSTELRRELKCFLQLLLIYLFAVHRWDQDAASMQTLLLPMCTDTLWGKTSLLLGIHSDGLKTRFLYPPGDHLTRKKRASLVSASPTLLWYSWEVLLVMGGIGDNNVRLWNQLILQFHKYSALLKTSFSTNGLLLP